MAVGYRGRGLGFLANPPPARPSGLDILGGREGAPLRKLARQLC